MLGGDRESKEEGGECKEEGGRGRGRGRGRMKGRGRKVR